MAGVLSANALMALLTASCSAPVLSQYMARLIARVPETLSGLVHMSQGFTGPVPVIKTQAA